MKACGLEAVEVLLLLNNLPIVTRHGWATLGRYGRFLGHHRGLRETLVLPDTNLPAAQG